MITLSPVRDHIPLEQGLRHHSVCNCEYRNKLRDHIPLKQGLRHITSWVFLHLFDDVQDHIPLKQGLRRPNV